MSAHNKVSVWGVFLVLFLVPFLSSTGWFSMKRKYNSKSVLVKLCIETKGDSISEIQLLVNLSRKFQHC